MSAITITIPTQLDRRITPNGRSHWRVKHRLQQELKHAAWACTVDACARWQPEPPLVLTWTIAHGKGRKRLDDDNAKASLKAAQDGIAAALDIDDRHITVGTVEQIRDAEGIGFIAVTIAEGEITPQDEMGQ